MTKIFTLLILLFCTVNSLAQDGTSKVGTTAANFLLFEVGSKAIGMGGAFVGISDDASSLFWNPAGSALLQKPTALYQISNRFADVDHHFAGIVFPITTSDKIGVSVNYIAIGQMEVTTIEKPEGTGEEFEASNIAIGLTYSKQLTDRVSIGVTAKYIHEKIWLETASGFAIDIGTLYNIAEIGFTVGMNIVNLGPDMGISDGPHLSFYKEKSDDYPGSPTPTSQLNPVEYPLPLSFSVGISNVLIGRNSSLVSSADHKATFAFSVNDSFDTPFRANIGAEYVWKELLAFRGGYRNGYDTQKFSLGFGIDFSMFENTDVRLDYAWVDFNDLGGVSTWSLEFRF